MTSEELLEALSYKPMIKGFGGVITQIEGGDVTYDDHLVLRKNEQGEWWVWQLVTPMFAVGDCIRAKDTHGEGSIVKAIDYETGCYIFDQGVKGSYVSMEYELVHYEPKDGDIVRKKGEEKPHYRISNNVDGLPGQGEFFISQIMEAGIAGGYISRYELQRDYVLVERYVPLQQALDTFNQQVANALKEEAAGIAQEVEIVLDGVRHRLITNPDIEDCKYCSLDKICDRFKDAICNVFKGQSGCHIFQKVGEN